MEKQIRKEKYGGVVWLVSWFRTSVLYYMGSCMPGTDILSLPSCHSGIQEMASVARGWPDAWQLQLGVMGRGTRLGFPSGRIQGARAARSCAEGVGGPTMRGTQANSELRATHRLWESP